MSRILILIISIIVIVNFQCAKIKISESNRNTQPLNNMPVTPNNSSIIIPPTTLPENFSNSNNNQATIQVIGEASGNVASDLVKINIEIDSKNNSAADALSMNTELSNDAREAFSNFNIPIANITTSDFSVTPNYNNTYNPDTQIYTKIFDGYLVQNQIVLTLGDFSQAGQIIDAIVGSDGVQINSIVFSTSNAKQNAFRDKLIEDAVKDAVNKANLSLKAVNHQVQSIKSISITTPNNSVTPIYATASFASDSAAGSSPPTLYGNNQQLNIQATVTFFITPIPQNN